MMYRKMLVPLEASELAVVAFPYAKEIAARLDLDVILLHVHSPEERSASSQLQADIEHRAEILKRQLDEVRKRIRVDSEAKLVQVRGEVAAGSPAEVILRFADENDIDVIVMATHARSGVKRLVVGSVAEKVLRKSSVPIWLVRPGAPEEAIYDQWPGKMLLVPLDGSELAEAVLPHVEVLAKQRGTEPVEVVLTRICTLPTAPVYGDFTTSAGLMHYDYIEAELARRKQMAGKYLAEIEGSLKSAGLLVRSEVLDGRPAEQIINYANAHPCNVIVMSTHARSGPRRLALGSVAAEVLRGASTPMVLVKTGKPQSDQG